MARVTFDSIFKKLPDGRITPIQKIRVGGVTLGPGVFFGKGVSFGGIDFSQFVGNDLEIDTDKEIIVIKGIYKK